MDIRIAAAQSRSISGDIAGNIQEHLKFIDQAHARAVDLIVFPELSLTGYELESLSRSAIRADDCLLDPLANASQKYGMVIVVGLPLLSLSKLPHIASLVFFPDGSREIYAKAFLHLGEEAFAAPSNSPPLVINVNGFSCALAICADTAYPSHLQAVAGECDLYLASMLVSDFGFPIDAENLRSSAFRHRVGVLMANHAARSGNFDSAGRSSFWSAEGCLVEQVPGRGNYLLVMSYSSGDWSGECIQVE
ncbi:carbon-nitrogen hydrolase family protein [Aquipseudomonas alcaligenes]|uniref:Carbon-nitrogen hydrolase family protein n=1 Tax=Aquipseudomonas alcaligenes TaxID=43263 RepID=A0A2V4L5T6_AQUAC|nr:carbon-nitrogen hydrolase family protein [Pseudomonas alcaligenes]PYC20200.1 carbon-nitrogen hydrolase family protein [Pseudomonas alcaligenes]